MPKTYELHRSITRTKSERRERPYRHTGTHDPENLILKALPREQYNYLRRYLQLVPLRCGDVLWEPSQTIESVYFPISGMVSFVALMRNGAMVEVGITGREGFVGTPVVLSARADSVRAVVQIEGHALRIESDLLRRILPRIPQLDQMLRLYANTHAMQAEQIAACNCFHQVPERLACWLATMSYGQAEFEPLPLTQEFLSQMLGCRRASVNAAIGALQSAGVIRCIRGHVCIVNRKDLERRACECYEAMQRLSHTPQID